MGETSPLKLSDHTINAIDQCIGDHLKSENRLRKGVAWPGSLALAAAPWFSSIGALLSGWLPGVVEILASLGAKGVTAPTLLQFCQAGVAILGGTEPVPAPAK